MTIAWPTEDPDLPPPRPQKRWIWPALAGGVVVITATVVALVVPSQEPQVATPVAATAPTTTTTPVTSSAPPPTTETFEGKGDSVLELKRAASPGVLTFECPQCTGNVAVEANGLPLLKVVGAYNGQKLINVDKVTTTVSVKTKGAWKLTVADPQAVSGPANGRGDSVLMLAGTFKSAKVTNQGKGAFVVTYADLSANRLTKAISRTGNYQGTVMLPGPAIVQIQSTGTWTITPT